MKRIFDYMYYRLTKVYFKWDGRAGITAIIAIAMVQTLLVSDILAIIVRSFFDRTETSPYSKMFSYIGAIITIVFISLNYYKYNGQYNRLRFQWKNETRQESFIRLILVWAFLILSWVPIVLIGIYW